MKKRLLLCTIAFFVLTGFHGDRAELCLAEIQEGECTAPVIEGGIWGSLEGEFYLNFFVGEGPDLWAHLNAYGDSFEGIAVHDQFSPKERTFHAAGAFDHDSGWIELLMVADDGTEQTVYFRADETDHH